MGPDCRSERYDRAYQKMNITKVIGLIRDERSGATAIEYGLITAMISVVILGALILTGTELSNTFDFIGKTLSK